MIATIEFWERIERLSQELKDPNDEIKITHTDDKEFTEIYLYNGDLIEFTYSRMASLQMINLAFKKFKIEHPGKLKLKQIIIPTQWFREVYRANI